MSQLFFTKAAALRILQAQGIAAKQVETLRIFKGSIQVTYLTKNGRCSTFLSKTAFYNDFITFRIEGAKTCTVQRWGVGSYQNHYDVFSSKTEKTYVVKLLAGLGMCGCRDDEQQSRQLGKAKPGCKHLMAVMSHLGHASLQDYMDDVAAKASMKRCSICGGTGAIHDLDDYYPVERCYHCRGLGYEKVMDLAERAKFDLIGGGWDEPTSTTTTVAHSVTTCKKTQVDPFGGFNF